MQMRNPDLERSRPVRVAPPAASRLLAACAACLVLSVTGCDREEVHSYRVPKSDEDSRMASGRMPRDEVNPELPARGAASADAVRVVWDLPAGWKQVESNQPMRVATFDASGSEVTITAFPGAAGGNLANVNRWRGQIGLPAIGEGELAALLSTSRVNQAEVSTLAMTGADGKVMLGAIVTPGDGKTWFVKSTTDATKAAALRPEFEAFARTLRLDGTSAGAAAGSAVQTNAPISTATSTATNTATNTATGATAAGSVDARLAHFTPPTGWTVESQASGIVAAAFNAANGAGGARITATSLANDGGGDLANINRWRGQLGLAALADLAQVQFSDIVAGAKAVDLVNDGGTDRMISVIVPAGGSTWFFKLRGAPAGVDAERAQFAAFVRAVGLGQGS